jgi:putative ABC transport system ATP-binding protein
MRRQHRRGQTIVLVTNDPHVAAAAQRVVRMRDGRIVDSGAAVAQAR